MLVGGWCGSSQGTPGAVLLQPTSRPNIALMQTLLQLCIVHSGAQCTQWAASKCILHCIVFQPRTKCLNVFAPLYRYALTALYCRSWLLGWMASSQPASPTLPPGLSRVSRSNIMFGITRRCHQKIHVFLQAYNIVFYENTETISFSISFKSTLLGALKFPSFLDSPFQESSGLSKSEFPFCNDWIAKISRKADKKIKKIIWSSGKFMGT